SLWISHVDGTSITSGPIEALANTYYTFSAAIVAETSGIGRGIDATYDILIGQDAANAVSVLGGPVSVLAVGDDEVTPDSKADQIFTNEFVIDDITIGDKLFIKFTRIGVHEGLNAAWFGVDDVALKAPIGIEVIESDGDTKVNEGGASDSYEISLLGDPDENVDVLITPDEQLDVGGGRGVAVIITFVPGSTTSHVVNVTAYDDDLSEGPHFGVITHRVTSDDPVYNGITDLQVTIEDNEPYCGDAKTVYLASDLNKDCYIDLEDLAILAAEWLQCSNPADLNCYANVPPEPLRQFDVFAKGQDGINTYRIPSLITAPDGSVLAFSEARKFRSTDKSPTMMVLRRSLNNGLTWEPMQILHDVGNDAAMDSTPVVDKTTGVIWLLYEVWPEGWNSNPVPGLEYPSTTVWAQSSSDNGITWSGPIDITSQVKLADWDYYANGPGVGIQTVGGSYPGRMIIPCHHRGGTVGTQHWYYSDDHGATWQIGNGYHTTGSEAQMVELIDGTLLWNIRGGGSAGRKISYSYDDGATWSATTNDPALIEPRGCQASILRYTRTDLGDDKNRILFSNPASTASRVNMTVKMSYDECQTWPVSKQIYAGGSAYSCLTILADGSIGLLYEADGYGRIVFARFTLKWLTDSEDWLLP
ncbi:MAG: exo-alpha-sialidase, partial [Anaerohalosphaera sp.]|nr:exo-alpha-sialidase [Anaerohalosphaera sp.]